MRCASTPSSASFDASSALFAVTTGLPAASAAVRIGSIAVPPGHLDDDVDLGIADELERSSVSGMPAASGPRALVRSRTAIRETRKRDAVAIGDGALLALDHLEQAAAHGAAADHADAQLAHRLDADALEARPGADPGLAAERAGAAQQFGEPVLIGQERVVPEHRVERPQRRLRAGGLQLAVQLHLQRPREQHVAGHADDDGVGGDPLERRAQRPRRRCRSSRDRSPR